MDVRLDGEGLLSRKPGVDFHPANSSFMSPAPIRLNPPAQKPAWLSKDGVFAASLFALVFIFLKEWLFLEMMLLFFGSSSILTQWRSQAKQKITRGASEKTGKRDFFQVLANGGIPLCAAIAFAFYPMPSLFLAYLGSLAAVTADTWATEIGLLSTSPPRLIFTRKIVPPGRSGGVTLAGFFGGISGSLLLGVFTSILLLLNPPLGLENVSWSLLVFVSLVSGILGMTADSALGGYCQELFYCLACQQETEQRVHVCSRKSDHIRGFRFMNNDGVNLICSLVGFLAGVVVS